jgi:hypothetical protein
MRATGGWMLGGWRGSSVLALAAVGSLALAACGGSSPAVTPSQQSAAAALASPSLATSLAGTDGTSWAVVEMGGSAAGFDNFWELFARPAGGSAWNLVTPAGVASNGGMIMTQAAAGTLVTGFRPSQKLTFSPLAASADAGAQWSQRTLLSPGLANVPGALAGDSGDRLLALTDTGAIESGTGLGASWTRLTTLRALASSPGGRACGLTELTAVAWTPAGTPMVAGTCRAPGVAGIFIQAAGSWHAAGPGFTGAAGRSQIDVLGLTGTGGRMTAILAGGTGAAAFVVAAWSADGGARWALSPELHTPGLGAGARPSVAFLADGAAGLAVTAGQGQRVSQAATIGYQASRWLALPPLPAARSGGSSAGSSPGQLATLAASAGGTPQALVVNRGTMTVWQLGSATGAGGWTLVQTIRVPIPYGSSG